MAIIHKAELHPTKLELLEGWLPHQAWFTAPGATLRKMGSFRFDDPEGEVGLETILVAGDSTVYQVPLSYRGAPLRDAEPALMGTMQHSVLGTRWVYDACGDPCYVDALAEAILTGRPQAVHYLDAGGTLEAIPETMVVSSTGPGLAAHRVFDGVTARTADAATVVQAGERQLTVIRRLDLAEHTAEPLALTGTWAGQPTPVTLAAITGG